MRVQRAPNAAQQPQRPPTIPVAPTAGGPATLATGFSAEIDVDLTDLLKRLRDESLVTAEVVFRLVAACRQEQLIDDESAVRVLTPAGAGFVGVEFGNAVHQSAYAISSGLKSPGRLPASTARTLTVVDLSGTRTRVTGDWGLSGLGVVTLGRTVPVVVSAEQPDGRLCITTRRSSHVGLTAPAAMAQGVARALDALARSVEGPAA